MNEIKFEIDQTVLSRRPYVTLLDLNQDTRVKLTLNKDGCLEYFFLSSINSEDTFLSRSKREAPDYVLGPAVIKGIAQLYERFKDEIDQLIPTED